MGDAEPREAGDRHAEGHTLNNLAVTYERLGEYRVALDYHRRALTLLRETGSRGDECEALVDAGRTLCAAGRLLKAREHCSRALDLAKSIGDPYLEARALEGLADIASLADRNDADHGWQEALRIYVSLGTPEAAAVRDRLNLSVASTQSP